MGRLDGRIVAITGGGSGIGRAAAELFAQEGARLFLVGRTLEKLEETAGPLRRRGCEVVVHAADLQYAQGVDEAFDHLLEHYGHLDVLVNNAGVGSNWAAVSPGSMEEIAATPIDKYHEVMRINLDSVFFMSRRAIQSMLPRRSGALVNISSIYGLVGAPSHHTYSMTKAAIGHLTKSMAVRYARDGIRSNCIVPGFIDTPMNDPVRHLLEEDPKFLDSFIPAARPGSSAEVALACLFLASDEASYVNGAILPVDGGWSAT